jgi:serine/threonine-protein kinase
MSDQLERLTAALAGRYAIEREIGVGGMATVYLAEDLRHRRKVLALQWRAGIAAALEDRRRAVQVLSEAIAQGYTDLLFDDANPLFESLWDDPQFQRLRRPRP